MKVGVLGFFCPAVCVCPLERERDGHGRLLLEHPAGAAINYTTSSPFSVSLSVFIIDGAGGSSCCFTQLQRRMVGDDLYVYIDEGNIKKEEEEI